MMIVQLHGVTEVAIDQRAGTGLTFIRWLTANGDFATMVAAPNEYARLAELFRQVADELEFAHEPAPLLGGNGDDGEGLSP